MRERGRERKMRCQSSHSSEKANVRLVKRVKEYFSASRSLESRELCPLATAVVHCTTCVTAEATSHVPWQRRVSEERDAIGDR